MKTHFNSYKSNYIFTFIFIHVIILLAFKVNIKVVSFYMVFISLITLIHALITNYKGNKPKKEELKPCKVIKSDYKQDLNFNEWAYHVRKEWIKS